MRLDRMRRSLPLSRSTLPRRLIGLICALAAVLTVGCTSDPKPQSQASSSSTGEPQDASTPAVTAGAGRDPRTKWIGNIPYDVFYDRPLEVYHAAAGTEAAPGEPMTIPEAAAPGPTTETAAVPAGTDSHAPAVPEAAPAQIDWAAIAPIDILEAETKEMRTRLTANLQTLAAYNANHDSIETDGSVLAVIAAIIERHPQELNWKPKAKFVRQLAYDMYVNASGNGRGPFESTKEPFEQIMTIWAGGKPPDLEVADLVPLGEVGDRSRIMVRIESSFNWLRSDVNSPDRLKEERERVIREATVLSALGAALGDPSFDTADDPGYQALLQQFMQGQQDMIAAARNDQFADYEAARDRVQKSCDACHLEYRNSSDSGF